MKLLFIIPEYPPHFGGGIGTFYAQFLPSLVELGHAVKVLVANPFGGEFSNYTEQGIEVSCLPHAAIATQLPLFEHYAGMPELRRVLATAWAAWDFVKGGQGFDAVETTDWGLLFAPWVVTESAPPTVVQLHASMGQIDFYDPQLDKQVQGHLVRLLEISGLTSADELQTYSATNAQYWSELTGRSVSHLPPAFGCPPDSTDATPEFPCAGKGMVVGRIQYWKGAEVLCKALQRRTQQGLENPSFLWIGRDTAFQYHNGSMSAYLQAHYPGIWGQQVESLGALSGSRTQHYQRNAEFILVPSIWDVFNFTCVEGMALGKAVLCSEGAGAAHLIESGVNGIRFAANDPQALANALDQWMGLSATQKLYLGEAAQDTIRTQLNPLHIAQQRSDAYSKLVHRGRSPMKANDWLRQAIAPHPPVGHKLAFLDYLPLKDLAQYVLQRGWQKLRS